MCADSAVYLPTFNPENLTVTDLKKAATGPERTLSMLGGGIGPEGDPINLRPSTSRVLRFGSNEGASMRVDRLFLVPGGRYLVTEGVALCIWDLNERPKPSKPALVEHFDGRNWHDAHFFFVCPAADYTTFRIVISGTWRNEDTNETRYFFLHVFSATIKLGCKY